MIIMNPLGIMLLLHSLYIKFTSNMHPSNLEPQKRNFMKISILEMLIINILPDIKYPVDREKDGKRKKFFSSIHPQRKSIKRNYIM